MQNLIELCLTFQLNGYSDYTEMGSPCSPNLISKLNWIENLNGLII